MGLFTNLFNKSKLDNLSFIGKDIHSHLIPGIDDGSKSMDDTIAMLNKFWELGYKKVITTPHTNSDLYKNTPEIILKGLNDVKAELKRIQLPIEIEAASEYFFDETLYELIENNRLLTFAGNHVLIEFSFFTAPYGEEKLFFDLQTKGFQPVLAHFERYSFYHNSGIDKAIELRNKGVNIQLNLNSLSGHYGPDVRKQAERLVDAKVVDFVGTDCHRIEHLTLLESQLDRKYFLKLKDLNLKNHLL